MSDKKTPIAAALIVLLILAGVLYFVMSGKLNFSPSKLGKGGALIAAPGLAIIEFYPDQKEIAAGDTVGVNLEIANNGEYPAKEVTASLYRMGKLMGAGGTTITSWAPSDLDPLDLETGVPSDKREWVWHLMAPEGLMGTQGYNLGVRVDYRYKAEGWADILITQKEEVKVQAEQGGQAQASGGHTKAPLVVDIKAAPVMYYSDLQAATDTSFPIRIDLTNSGGGKVMSAKGSGPVAEQNLDKIESIQVKVPKAYVIPAGTNVTDTDAGMLYCAKKDCNNSAASGTDYALSSVNWDYLWLFDDTSNSEYYIFTKTLCKPAMLPSSSLLSCSAGKYVGLSTTQVSPSPGTTPDPGPAPPLQGWVLLALPPVGDAEALNYMRYSLDLLGGGTYNTYVLWFNVDKDAVSLQQLVGIRAGADYYYSATRDTLVTVRGEAVG
ncbi:MAG: hypothetical protein ABH829_03880 [archaeon]